MVGGFDVVLDEHRYAEQREGPIATSVKFIGALERGRIYRENGPQLRVVAFDAPEEKAHDVSRGNGLCAVGLQQVGDRAAASEEGKIVGHTKTIGAKVEDTLLPMRLRVILLPEWHEYAFDLRLVDDANVRPLLNCWRRCG